MDWATLGIEGATTFLATGLGVLGAFWLDRRTERQRESDARAADEARRAQVLRQLTDAVQYDLSLIQSIRMQSALGAQQLLARGFRTNAWDALKPELMRLVDDVQVKTDFAVFFDYVRQAKEVLDANIPVPGDGAFSLRLRETALRDAWNIGLKIVDEHGTPAQKSAFPKSAAWHER